MKKPIRKRSSITRKIRAFLPHKKGKQPHKLYPKEYFWRCWFNEQDTICVNSVAHISRVTKKHAAHILNELGFKCFMGQLGAKQIELMNTPEGRAGLQKRTRYYLELRRLCKQRGWDIKKLL